ncbi:hypothetical protein [Methylocystis sp. ATCC 49242]|uniref:hypothetical protein n=1 Tax=Methylocystis sp. ATCC 49242 TaxID=622637 RepID=UPI0001F875A7|nr:hypothetical protein [Methylocystis sp. ATCC 49242]
MSSPRVTVILAVVDDVASARDKLVAILASTDDNFRVLAAGNAGMEAAERIPQPLAGRIAFLTGSFRSAAEAFAAGAEEADGDVLAFVGPADRRDFRRLDRDIARLAELAAPALCVAAPARRDWPAGRPNSAASVTVADIIAGDADTTSLIVEKNALAAVGGVDASAGDLALFDLALRLALREMLAVERSPELIAGSYAPSSLEMDDRVAARIGEARALAPAITLALGESLSAGSWLLARMAFVRHLLCASGESTDVRLLGADGANPLDALRLACSGGATDFVIVSVISPSPALVAAQSVRMEVEGLDACLPTIDNGLFAETTGAGAIVGTRFRKAAVLEAFRLIDGQEPSVESTDACFWRVFAARSTIGAVAYASPRSGRHTGAPWWAPPFDCYGELERSLADRLVDPAFYLAKNLDVAGAGVDPVEHYRENGWREGRDPNGWFSTQWYLSHSNIPEDARPLEHFVRVGAAAGLAPHPDADIARDAAQRVGAYKARAEALRRRFGDADSGQSLVDRLIDPEFYLGKYPDVAAAGADPVEHYRGSGWREERDPNRLFCTGWYRALPGVPQDVCPLEHFVQVGAAMGLAPHPDVNLVHFSLAHLNERWPRAEALLYLLEQSRASGAVADIDPASPAVLARLVDRSWYLETHADVAAAGCDPVAHYLEAGQFEGRAPNPWFLPDFYCEKAGLSGDTPALAHFVRSGAAAGVPPHPAVDLCFYAARYLGQDSPSIAAYQHLLDSWRTEDAQLSPDCNPRPLTLTEERSLRRLVAADWYRTAYPDIAAADVDAFDHYMVTGWREGRDPNPWFAAAWYRKANGIEPLCEAPELSHFVRVGAARGLSPHPDLDLARYAQIHFGEPASARALAHLVKNWSDPAFWIFPELDHPFVAAFLADLGPVARRAQIIRLMRLTHPLAAPAEVAVGEASPFVAFVDTDWYHAHYPDVEASGATPAADYLESGWRIGRDPSPAFSTIWYLDNYPEVAAAGVCPLEDYVIGGARDGRRPDEIFDREWYARRYNLKSAAPDAALLDYVTTGWRRGRAPSALFEHPAVKTHLMEKPVRERGDEIRRLHGARKVFETTTVTMRPAEAELWRTVLLWSLPPRATPYAIGKSDALTMIIEPSAAILRVDRGAGVVTLSVDGAENGHALRFEGAESEEAYAAFLTRIGAREVEPAT